MKYSILVIVNNAAELPLVEKLKSRHNLQFAVGVEAAIEQLYGGSFDGVLYELFPERSEQRKFSKILSLESPAPEVLMKQSWEDWQSALDTLSDSLKVQVNLVDGSFDQDIYRICLN